jgi:hypothetical protein
MGRNFLNSAQLSTAAFIIAAVQLLVSVRAVAHPARFHRDRASGLGHLMIEIDGADADISFSAVSADVFGFSDPPVLGDKRKIRTVDGVRRGIKSFGADLIRFSDKLNCKTRVLILGEFVGDHGSRPGDDLSSENDPLDAISEADLKAALEVPKNDLVLRFAVHCSQDIKGSAIKLGISAHFPNISRVRTYLLEGGNAKGSEIEQDQGELTP